MPNWLGGHVSEVNLYRNVGPDPFNQNFRIIFVQNSMDRFGPTGKGLVSKKLVHLKKFFPVGLVRILVE